MGFPPPPPMAFNLCCLDVCLEFSLSHSPSPTKLNSTAVHFFLPSQSFSSFFSFHLFHSLPTPPPQPGIFSSMKAWKANFTVFYVLPYVVYKTETERKVAQELCITILVQYLEH